MNRISGLRTHVYIYLSCTHICGCHLSRCHSVISQGLTDFFSEEPARRYFWLGRPYGLCCSYSTLPLSLKSSHRQHTSECVPVQCTATGREPDWAHALQFADPRSVSLIISRSTRYGPFLERLSAWHPYTEVDLGENQPSF